MKSAQTIGKRRVNTDTTGQRSCIEQRQIDGLEHHSAAPLSFVNATSFLDCQMMAARR
jgi:hypothetical protein